MVLIGALQVLWKDNVSTNYVADCRSACVVVFNEMIGVAVCLIEETELRLAAQEREEVLEGQTRHRSKCHL